MDKPWTAAAREAARMWREARFPVALTGAGISVASGIPDFRSEGGVWTRHDPAEVATLQALWTNPNGVWRFLLELFELLAQAEPNSAHTALAELEQAGRLAGIITQNIDGLHQRGGSNFVVEYHGGCSTFYCMRCKEDHDAHAAMALTRESIPMLCSCGGLVRPDIVFFNEMIPPAARRASEELAERADLCVVIGTSGEVAPANTIPRRIKQAGGRVLEINLGPSSYEPVADVTVRGPAEQVLPFIALELAD